MIASANGIVASANGMCLRQTRGFRSIKDISVAELLGFYQDGEMKKVEKETYFVSSTSASAKDKDCIN
jgi:hypothetical protein